MAKENRKQILFDNGTVAVTHTSITIGKTVISVKQLVSAEPKTLTERLIFSLFLGGFSVACFAGWHYGGNPYEFAFGLVLLIVAISIVLLWSLSGAELKLSNNSTKLIPMRSREEATAFVNAVGVALSQAT